MANTQNPQLMPGAVKLCEPLTYDGMIDYEVIEAWLFNVDNYYAIVGLMDEV